MKIAVSIPDEVFRKAEELADRLEVSRSRLYAAAIAEYTAAHSSERIRERLDEVYGATSSELDTDLALLQAISLPPEKW